MKKKFVTIISALALSFLVSNSTVFANEGTNTVSKNAPTIKNVLSTAKQYIGVPYVFGGTSSKGIDCSGFTQNVFWKNGKTLPRTAKLQFEKGNWVSKEDLKPGDMVFFTTYKPGASHVGIFLGKDKFIHASSGKGEVTISKLSKNYYRQRYIGAKRMIN